MLGGPSGTWTCPSIPSTPIRKGPSRSSESVPERIRPPVAQTISRSPARRVSDSGASSAGLSSITRATAALLPFGAPPWHVHPRIVAAHTPTGAEPTVWSSPACTSGARTSSLSSQSAAVPGGICRASFG